MVLGVIIPMARSPNGLNISAIMQRINDYCTTNKSNKNREVAV